jgi:tetratricopeptide (TPR) repeat protein
MLGLTDREISHHPDYIPGIPSSWKERKYNAGYVLSQDPDFIIFSTGGKPSAPAERALLLYSEFRQNYHNFILHKGNKPLSVFRRKGSYEKENQIYPDARFVNLYNEALNLKSRKDYNRFMQTLSELLEICPEDFVWAYVEMGKAHRFLGNNSEAKRYLTRAIEMDPYCVTARGFLAKIYLEQGKYEKVLKEYEAINSCNPGLVERAIRELKILIDKERETGIGQLR